VHLDPGLTRAYAALFGRRHGASLYMTLLAAFQVLLARLGGQDDGDRRLAGRRPRPTGGRRASSAYFVNAPAGPVRGSTRASRFDDFLGRLSGRRTSKGSNTRPSRSALIAERVAAVLDPSRSPVFQVLFVLKKAQRLD